MRFTGQAVVVAALALLAVCPTASEAQSASIQASVTVLAPSVQPSVRIEASGVAEGEPAVVVEGRHRWTVSVRVGAEGYAVTRDPGPAGRLELSASDWATLARDSGTSAVPVRVVLAAP